MTNFLDVVFILQFIAIIGIFLYKLYNILHKAQKYDFRVAILLFVGFAISWSLGLINIMYNISSTIYIQLFKFETWLFAFNIIFLLVELFLLWHNTLSKPITSYSSIDAYKNE